MAYCARRYASEDDDALSFYPQDLMNIEDVGEVNEKHGSLCDIFRTSGLTVVHAAEPDLHLPFPLHKPKPRGSELLKWAESLSTRSRKNFILLDWLEQQESIDPAELSISDMSNV